MYSNMVSKKAVKVLDYTASFTKFYDYANQLRVVKNPKRLHQLQLRAKRSVGMVHD